ncbi:hypothetical protein GCM10011519_11220 [Marmoricola endophyticus]|uniref:Uncharacterized protein n=1 Tax=Marmoricola endophyticus TaxID=2040280 RepID=A0A917F2U0_9ACTN|nr:hypothetical protein GCM10011519_11220 [Marmoricola endophyticus]
MVSTRSLRQAQDIALALAAREVVEPDRALAREDVETNGRSVGGVVSTRSLLNHPCSTASSLARTATG